MVAGAMMSLSAFYAFAAQQGWSLEGNDWYYYDSHGDRVTDSWKDNDSKTYKFYLGDDGKMLTSQLVEHNGDYYYVNGDGVMSTNQWRWAEDPSDGDYHWYYFDGNGKAYSSGWKTINNKKYHFTDSKMDYGWLSEDGTMIDEDWDNDDSWESAKYYAGTEDQGWRFENSWLELESFDTDKYTDSDTLWVYFGSNGEKFVNKQSTINGVKYRFDDNGAMLDDWYEDNVASSSNAKYYGTEGNMTSGKWFKAVPSENMDNDDYESDTERWFYATSNGNVVKDTIKKINGKYYIFDDNGIMKTGFLVVNNKKVVEELGNDEDGYPTSKEIKAATGGDIMFFSESGAATTNRVTIELGDDKFTMKFNSKGVAVDGIDDGYLYDNGILIKAESGDEKYTVATYDGKEYLVNTSGKVMKAGTYKDTKTDKKYTVTGSNSDGYTISAENI